MKNLFLISQDYNNDYDTFDSAVVVAESEEDAIKIHPHGRKEFWNNTTWVYEEDVEKHVQVKYIGKASDTLYLGQVVCSSFRAG